VNEDGYCVSANYKARIIGIFRIFQRIEICIFNSYSGDDWLYNKLLNMVYIGARAKMRAFKYWHRTELINNLNNKLINKVYCYAKGFSFSECAMQSSLYQV